MTPNQVLSSAARGVYQKTCIWSPDTDVLLLLVDLAVSGQMTSSTSFNFHTGKRKKKREIDNFERVQVTGRHKCQGLLGRHNFHGANWGGRFRGISKKSWVDAYIKLDDDEPATDRFKSLRCISVSAKLVNVVSHVYTSRGPATLPSLRWQLFLSENLEREMFPQTRAALLPISCMKTTSQCGTSHPLKIVQPFLLLKKMDGNWRKASTFQ